MLLGTTKDIQFVYHPISDWHRRWDLTPGKIYVGRWNEKMIYSSNGTYYKLTNDSGKVIEVHENHLVSLEKVREEKLKILLHNII